MNLYNTLTRQKEELKPLKRGTIGLYCCGPTVYNYAHIGNLRTFLFEDFLRRALEFSGYKVNQVMNITDVGHLTSDADEGEDKMAKGAKREHKTVWEIAKEYTDAFFADVDALNIRRATRYPRATDHIREMIALIRRLEKNGFTYVAGGNVYFDTSKLNDYGKLAGAAFVGTRHALSLQDVARVETDPNKKHPRNFVLWFTESKHGNQDMQWESPWGRGFPGWHIECSAMSMKYLGDHFDIHCGGIDHISVHHTNEIAQSEGALGKEWVHTWLHGNFLTIKDARMAKSGGNFLTLQVLKDKGFDALDYRYFCLQAHYSQELTFSWEGLDAAKTALRRLKEKIKKILVETQNFASKTQKTKNKYLSSFTAALADDLNMPQALALVWELVDDGTISAMDKLSTVQEMDKVLGLKLDEKTTFDIPEGIRKLVDQRNAARAKKDWKASDALRDQIQAAGYVVKDESGRTVVEPK
ncbi:cysteine--tRNA ligase [Candidatus Peregrinibacteria bacterium]|nr:cysteine--tRNA ligase [Candidatus Peregrinibacteria bacterium]